jgi:2-polyprenyl-3-methyl-5-hydroxy-6-metoxy-1,4-benzoquinol methylase
MLKLIRTASTVGTLLVILACDWSQVVGGLAFAAVPLPGTEQEQEESATRQQSPQDEKVDPREARLRERERVRQLRTEGTIESRDDRPAGVPAGLTHYKGREIAQTMHYMGAPWLTREERESEEKCSMMLANCKIRPGMSVCDMGCGNGFYSFRLAEMVGPEGVVYAVDIQQEMLVLLREEMERRGVDNIVPILGSVHHPRLPAGQIDAILLADVYHEFSHPEQMLAEMRQSLKPNGFAILLEFRSEDPNVPIKELHKMSKDQIMKEWPVNGFKLLDEFDGLTWQHMMFFGRDELAKGQ